MLLSASAGDDIAGQDDWCAAQGFVAINSDASKTLAINSNASLSTAGRDIP